MSGPAEIFVRGKRGAFVASHAEVEGPWLHASGRWALRCGADGERRYVGPPDEQRQTWPYDQVTEVRWSA